MNFNTLEFLLFLPAVLALHWALPHRLRWALLLASSWLFYFWWEPMAGLLLVAVTAATWLCGLGAAREKPPAVRRACLAMALGACLGCLGVFKYAGFFAGLIHGGPAWRLLLPVGISFYTFQALSYVLDVYRGRTAPEGHFGYYALFISFFPQLVAGPIERTRNLLPQIEGEHTFHTEKGIHGAKMIAWGFFKKIAIADTVAIYVDTVYNAAGSFTGFPLLLATVLFTFQIYCDFSGYSDIAVGTAELLDIDLMTNFKSPYFSASIREFWSRWHISLSTWFRDYVYIPLGGNRRGPWRTRWNLLVTFLVSGLWHGASWTYVLWGGIHGLGQILEREWMRIFHMDPKKKSWLRIGVTFLFVMVTWIFFRADTISDAFYVLTHLLEGITNPAAYLTDGYHAFQGTGMVKASGVQTLIISIVCILVLLAHDYLELTKSIWERIGAFKKPLRYALYFFLLFVILYSRQLGEYEFVYFQF